MRQFLTAFALTWMVESAVVYPFFRKVGWRRILANELLLNLTTHPLLWFGLLRLPGPYLRNLFLTEILVAIVEAGLGLYLYRGLGLRQLRIVWAIVGANAVTFLMTFLL